MDAELMNTIITVVVVPTLVWAFKLGRDWVLTKIQSSDSDLFKKYMNILTDVVYDVVQALMQTTVNTYKDQNGKLDEAFASALKADAILTIKQQLNNNITAYLEEKTGTQIENIIDTQIEKTVGMLKT
jgi:hypothetical protein